MAPQAPENAQSVTQNGRHRQARSRKNLTKSVQIADIVPMPQRELFMTPFSRRLAILGAALCLGVGVWLVLHHDAPAAGASLIALIAAIPCLCAAAFGLALDDEATRAYSIILGVAALAMIALGAVNLEPSSLVVIFGLASTGLLVAGGWSLWRASSGLARARFKGDWALGIGLVAALAIYSAYYIVASHDLMFADFMRNRKVSIAVAGMLDHFQFVQLLIVYAASAKEDYSWLPALAPGALMAVSQPFARWPYQATLILFYAAPAYLALGVLTRDLARGAGLRRFALNPAIVLALGAFVAFAAYPTAMAITARGMPDIGGLVLFVWSLRLAERLARILALAPGHDARVAAMARRVALALALSLFAMFLFRRWYVFAGFGIVAMLALEAIALAIARGASFRWREAFLAASLAGLTLFALVTPVLVDWLPDPAAHDYVLIYAAYRKEFSEFIAQIFDWYGLGVLALAVCAALLLWVYSDKARLLRLTVGSAVIAALLFLRVQTPYIHHVLLIAPAVTGVIGAGILLLFARSKPAALTAASALAIFTLTPVASALAPVGFGPTAGQPHSPRADLADLTRLKDWFDAHASPQHRVCALGSSYTFSDQLIQELWQLNPAISPFYKSSADRADVVMAHVDTAEGAPVAGLKDCAMMLVGDPVQTHLVPQYQETIIIPATEMLTGQGIGAKFKRSGETFALENGVKVIVFERTEAITNEDIAALAARWRETRLKNGVGLRGTDG